MTTYVQELQADMRSSYFNLITVSVDDVVMSDDVRQALGAQWSFLSDVDRTLIHQLDIVDVTDPNFSPVAIPFTFVLDGNLEIYKTYFGWWYVGRPTAEELRQDFRALMARRRDWAYDDSWDYHAIHSDKRYELTHGMMAQFHPKEETE